MARSVQMAMPKRNDKATVISVLQTVRANTAGSLSIPDLQADTAHYSFLSLLTLLPFLTSPDHH